MAEPPLEVARVSHSFGALRAIRDVSLALAVGEVHALIGPNGAGKTTLVNLIAGELAPDSGRIRLKGRDVTRAGVAARARAGLGRTFQVTSVLLGCSVLENVVLAVQAARPHLVRRLADPMQAPALLTAAETVLARVGLVAQGERPAGELAHGQKRRLELAMALAAEPSVLLLDEPMAGLGPEESRAMAGLLAALKGRLTLLLLEHDMDLVFSLADRVSVLVAGELVASGPPAQVRADARVREAYLGTVPC